MSNFLRLWILFYQYFSSQEVSQSANRHLCIITYYILRFSMLRICLQCRRHRRQGFSPWVGNIPWRRKWQPAPVLLLGEFHGLRSLTSYSPWGRKESDMTEQLSMHTQWLQVFWNYVLESNFKFLHNAVSTTQYLISLNGFRNSNLKTTIDTSQSI